MKIWSKTRLDQKLKPVLIEKADLLDVLEFPDERLRQKSQPVESIDENLEKLVYDMLNNKHAQIKNTAAELNDTIKTAKHAQTVATEKKPEVVNENKEPQEKKTGEIHFEPIVAQKTGKNSYFFPKNG